MDTVIVTLSSGEVEQWSDTRYEQYRYEVQGEELRVLRSNFDFDRWVGDWSPWAEVAYYPPGEWRRVGIRSDP